MFLISGVGWFLCVHVFYWEITRSLILGLNLELSPRMLDAIGDFEVSSLQFLWVSWLARVSFMDFKTLR